MSAISDLGEQIKRPEQPKSKNIKQQASQLRSLPTRLDDNGVALEMQAIEHCASTQTAYCYNIGWGEEVNSRLKEYAAICACECHGINPERIPEAKEESKKPELKTTASVESKKPAAMNIGDVFHIEDSGDMSHMASENWQSLTPNAKMSSPAAGDGAGSVSKIGGGENYLASPHRKAKPGQNSVMDPNAIGRLAESDTEDLAKSLREINEKRSGHRVMEQQAEERLAAKVMRDGGHYAGQGGTVRLTETLNAQPGLRPGKTMPGAFQTEVVAIPDRTAGENISAGNQAKKASIQRERDDAIDWEPSKRTRSMRSSSILDNLEETLKKTATSDNKGIMSFSNVMIPSLETPEEVATDEEK